MGVGRNDAFRAPVLSILVSLKVSMRVFVVNRHWSSPKRDSRASPPGTHEYPERG